MDENDYIEAIKGQTNLSKTEIETLVQEKIDDFRGNITKSVAFSMLYKELKLKKKQKKEVNIMEKNEQKVEIIEAGNKPEASKYALTTLDEQESIPINGPMTVTHYPSEREIEFLIKRRKFVKEKLIDSSDKVNISGKLFLKKSAWRKYINAFGISIDELYDDILYKDDDVIAIYRIKAIAPNGQFVVADGTKSKSEYWSEKSKNYGSYTLHNLKATARTRAINIGVSDLVGYGETSAEEMSGKELRNAK